MFASLWLRSWQRDHGVELLFEPRWRWSREDRRGWARGRGMMDPRDFYAASDRSPE